jgi:DNA-binding MarR family transcriptional regulator
MNIRLSKGFGMVSKAVMQDPNISLRDKGLYAYLSTYADKDDSDMTISVNRISAECGITTSTVKRILEDLIKKKVIQRVRRGDGLTAVTSLLK